MSGNASISIHRVVGFNNIRSTPVGGGTVSVRFDVMVDDFRQSPEEVLSVCFFFDSGSDALSFRQHLEGFMESKGPEQTDG